MVVGRWILVTFVLVLACSGDPPDDTGELDSASAGRGGTAGVGGSAIQLSGAGGDAGNAGGATGGSSTVGGAAGTVAAGAGGSGASTSGAGGSSGGTQCSGLESACNGACLAEGEAHDGCRAVYFSIDFENSVNDMEGVGEDLYFSTNQRIARIPNGGEEEVVYATTEGRRIEDIAIAGESAYFVVAEDDAYTVERVTLGGAGWEVLADSPGELADLQVAGDYLCALANASFENYLHCGPRAGGALVDSGYDVFLYTTFEDDVIFYGSNDEFGSNSLLRGALPVPFRAVPTQLARPTSFSAIGLTVAGDVIYYTGIDGIMRVPLSGGTPELVLDAGFGTVLEIIGDEAFLLADGVISSVQLGAGGEPTRIAEFAALAGTRVARTTSRVYVSDYYRLLEFTR